MATDFAQESRWKRAAAKTLADAVVRHFRGLEEERKRKEDEEMNRGRVLAGVIANDVMTQFWGKVKAVATIKVSHMRTVFVIELRPYR